MNLNEFVNSFTTGKRDNGEKFAKLSDEAHPDAQELVRAIHGDMLPDDYKYNAIWLAAESLQDYEVDKWDDATHEIADCLIDSYDSDQVKWLASHSDRRWYVGQAASEMGLSEPFDVVEAIRAGQYLELVSIIGQVVYYFESQLEDC